MANPQVIRPGRSRRGGRKNVTEHLNIWVRSSRFDWDNRPLFKIEPKRGFTRFGFWILSIPGCNKDRDWEGTDRCLTRRIDDTGVESTLLIPDWLTGLSNLPCGLILPRVEGHRPWDTTTLGHRVCGICRARICYATALVPGVPSGGMLPKMEPSS